MAKLDWGNAPKDYHMGISNGVMYLQNSDGSYGSGVVWNGIRSVTEIPTGGTISKIYADNAIYGSLKAREGLTGQMEVYDFPYELSFCNGWRIPAIGTSINLQSRKSFGFTYQTLVNQNDHITHIIYAMNLNPGERTYKVVGDSIDATVHGLEFITIPERLSYFGPVASVQLDSRKMDPSRLEYLESVLYGTDNEDARLLNYDEIVASEIRPRLVEAVETLGLWEWDSFFFPNDSVPKAIHREAETRVYYKPDNSIIQKRPGISYTMATENTSTQYQDRVLFLVKPIVQLPKHQSVLTYLEAIHYTSLIRTISSTDNYVIKEYSIYYKEEN